MKCGEREQFNWSTHHKIILLVSLNVKLFIFYKVNNSANIKLLVKVKVTQSCLTLCDPMNFSLPGFSVHGILQARTLEWVPFPGESSQLRDWTQVSCFAGGFFTIWIIYSGNCYINENQVFRGFFFPVFPPCSSLKIACQEVKTYLDN